MRVVRSQAAALGLDPDRIGIMGSSAGGHLTLMGATSSKRRAYWPIDDLDKLTPATCSGRLRSIRRMRTDGAEKPNTQGGNEDDSRLVPEFSFDLATCPILFIHGDADERAAMDSIKWQNGKPAGWAHQGDVHAGWPSPLLPAQGRSGHRQLHVDGAHLEIHEPQGLQQMTWR